MVTDYHQSASKTKEVDSLFQSHSQVLQLTIDGNAKRHKCPGSRVDSGMLATENLLHYLSKL
jgi:hypothetical protein